MNVILQKDVKDLGKVGDMVNVTPGFARNFLLPRRLAVVATETRANEFEHYKKVAEIKKKKALAERKSILDQLKGVNVTFKHQASDADRLFGSISTHDISKALGDLGFTVDKKDIVLPEPIKMLGQHAAKIQFGADLAAEILVTVERATSEVQ